MNAYEKAIALGLAGEPSEIVAKLQTLTVGPIPVANVLQWFDEQNLGELDAIENAWVGTLVDVVRNPQTPSPVAAGVRKLFAHLAKRTSQTVDTTDLSYSVEVFALLGALIQMGVVTVEQRDSFYALDGGRPYKDLTVEQFAEQKITAELLALKTAALDLVQNTAAEAAREECRKADSTPESIITAAVAVLGGA